MKKQFYKFAMICNRIPSLGADEDLEPSLRKRIKVTNKISLTLTILSIVFFFFWSSYNETKLALINGLAALIFIFPIIFNARRHFYSSRFFLLIVFNFSMFIIVGGIGKVAGIQISFYFLATISFILFGTNEKKSLAFSILMPMILFKILIDHDFKLFNLQFTSHFALNAHMFYYINFAFIILSMFYLSQETQRAENELSSTNEKLQSSQIFLKSIIENLPLAFYTRDMENRFTLVNSEFEKLFGVNKNDVLLKTDSEIFSKSKVDFLVLFDNEVFKLQSSKIFEASIGPEGEVDHKTFLCTKFPIVGPHRETFGICGIALDISDRIEAQKRLDEQRALIIDNVRLVALTDMANGMSHEINNPLAVLEMIHGKLSRISGDHNFSKDVLRDTLNKMQTAIQRITYIVSALRKFIEKPNIGKKETIDIKKMMEVILALSNEKMKQAGIELVFEQHGVPFNIVGQPSELVQVIYSLIANAFDAVVTSSKPIIIISTHYLDNVVKIVVQDSGPGVPKDLVSKLFQPFFTTKDVGQGQGLSLSIAKGIINAHGGRLIYDSSHELTTFVIELPKA